MSTRTTISITEGRKRLFDIAEEVQSPDKIYTLTEKGKPRVALMSSEEYESLMETLEVMRDFPSLDKDIRGAKKAIRTGAYRKFATLDTLKKDWGIALKKTRHAVRTLPRSKSKKSAR